MQDALRSDDGAVRELSRSASSKLSPGLRPRRGLPPAGRSKRTGPHPSRPGTCGPGTCGFKPAAAADRNVVGRTTRCSAVRRRCPFRGAPPGASETRRDATGRRVRTRRTAARARTRAAAIPAYLAAGRRPLPGRSRAWPDGRIVSSCKSARCRPPLAVSHSPPENIPLDLWIRTNLFAGGFSPWGHCPRCPPPPP